VKTKIQKTDAQLIKEGKFYGTHKRAKDLRKQRHARDVAFRMIENLPPGWKTPIYILPLGVRYKQDVQGDCQTQNRRLCRWLLAEPTRNLCDRKPYIYTQAAGRYSGRNHYARVNHIPRVRSCVKITPKRLLWFIGDGSGILHAPIGWQFGHDGNGVLLCKPVAGTHQIIAYIWMQIRYYKGGRHGVLVPLTVSATFGSSYGIVYASERLANEDSG
jgi:hypothetical protein